MSLEYQSVDARMRIVSYIAIVVTIVTAAVAPAEADRGAGSIHLSANPSMVPADGKSVSTISAQVRDRDGNLVPDGTEVRFSVDLGVIEETGDTSAGVARVKLVASDIPGRSTVTATWVEGQAVTQLAVDFVDRAVAVTGPNYISVDASDYLAYSLDYKTVEALGEVRIRRRSLSIEAGEAQIDLQNSRMVARSSSGKPLKVTVGESSLEGELFACDLEGTKGIMVSAAKGKVTPLDLRKPLDDPSNSAPDTFYQPSDLEFKDMSDSQVLIKAREAVIFPLEKIQFKRANLYVGAKRMLSIPLYVLSLTGYQPEGEQYVGYGSSGVTLNLPFYYSLTPSSSGVLMLRNGASSGWGWYGQTPGWFLDMRQSYSTEKSHGSVTISRLTGSDWGAHFAHNQRFDDRTDGYLFLDYPAHRDFYGSLNLNRTLEKVNLGLNVYGERYGGLGSSMITDFTVQTKPREIRTTTLKYTLSARSRYMTGSAAPDVGLSEALHASIYTPSIPLSSRLGFRSSFGVGYVFGSTVNTGVSVLASAVLNWKLSRASSFGLSYRYSDRSGFYSTQTGKQTLTATLLLADSDKWRATLYYIRGLDYSSSNVFGDVSYRLTRDWRLGVRSTLNEFRNVSYNDIEIALARRLGSRELMLVWSQSQDRLMFELGSGGF